MLSLFLARVSYSVLYSQFHSASLLFHNSLVIHVTWCYVTWPKFVQPAILSKKQSALFSSQESFRILNSALILVASKTNVKAVLWRQICLFTLLHMHPVHQQINNRWSGKHFTIERMFQNSADVHVGSCYQVNLVINIPYKTVKNINLH